MSQQRAGVGRKRRWFLPPHAGAAQTTPSVMHTPPPPQSCRLREAELTKGESRSRDRMQTVTENPAGDARNDDFFCLYPVPQPPAPIWGAREVSSALFCSPGLSKITEMLLMISSSRCGREGSRLSVRAGFRWGVAAWAEPREVGLD